MTTYCTLFSNTPNRNGVIIRKDSFAEVPTTVPLYVGNVNAKQASTLTAGVAHLTMTDVGIEVRLEVHDTPEGVILTSLLQKNEHPLFTCNCGVATVDKEGESMLAKDYNVHSVFVAIDHANPEVKPIDLSDVTFAFQPKESES